VGRDGRLNERLAITVEYPDCDLVVGIEADDHPAQGCHRRPTCCSLPIYKFDGTSGGADYPGDSADGTQRPTFLPSAAQDSDAVRQIVRLHRIVFRPSRPSPPPVGSHPVSVRMYE
jgi:hypothetical protein